MDDSASIVASMSDDELIWISSALKLPLTSWTYRREDLEQMILDRILEVEEALPKPRPLNDPAIEIKHMTKRFGKTVAVRDFDMVVRPGEIVGLVGPNGAGKTTTLRILAGIIRPTSGEIFVDGLEMHESAIDAKRRVGYIPERPSCYESLRVKEYLSFIAKVYGVPPHEAVMRIHYYSRLLQLEQFLHSYIGTLSKGNLQRTLLAGVFVRPEPYVLAFDEPIYGLDPRGAWSLKRHLKRLRDRGSAILISTHILEVAEGLCDRFVIMHYGRVVGRGTYDELHERFPHTKNLEEIFLELTGGIPEE